MIRNWVSFPVSYFCCSHGWPIRLKDEFWDWVLSGTLCIRPPYNKILGTKVVA